MDDDIEWHPVPMAMPAAGETASFELGGHELLLCNADGTPYVVQDRCPHARVSLAGGTITGTILVCPFHGGRLDLRDGAPAGMPIRRPARCFAVRDANGQLEVALPR